MARPTKRTPTAKERILAAIKLGATYELAAKAGGISYETFNEWRKEFSEFSESVNSAEAAAAQQWLKQIDKAARDGSWQAAAWKLERRYPQMYGRQVQEHTGEVKQTHEHSGAIAIQFSADSVLARIAGGPEADR